MRVEGTSLNKADHRGVNRADPEAAMGARGFFFLPGTLLRGECFGRATERNRGSGTAADQAMGQRKVGKMESISSEGLETAQTRVHVSARVLLLIQVKNPLSFFVSDETHGAG